MGEAYFADDKEEEGDMKFTCQYIPGEHFYKEASLINFKGDQHASIKIVDTKNEDNNKEVLMSKDSVESGQSTFQFKDSVEEDNMKIKGKEVTLSATEQKVFDVVKGLMPDAKDEDVLNVTKEVIALTETEDFVSNVKEAELDDDTAILFAIDECRTQGEEVNSDEITEDMRKELVLMKDEGVITEEEFTAADAKISTEGLTKLPDSVFCGPNRSFPVPDSAHAVAAKRLIGKYKGPGSKASILASVSLKTKALGDGSKDEKEPKEDKGEVQISPLTNEALLKLSSDELQNMYHVVEKELISRKETLKRDCSECAVHVKETETAKTELGVARDELTKSEQIVTVLRSELRKAYADYEAQVDEFVLLGAKLNTTMVEKLSVVSVLTQKYDTLENAREALKSVDVLKEETAIMDSLDLQAAALKINDGMARTPQGKIEDPADSTDGDNTQLPEGLSAPALEAIDNIKDCLSNNRNSDARQIYGTMKSLGLFGNDITFESLSVDNKETTDNLGGN
jgi:hypothetical protein